MRPSVVFIAGASRSGSTLLELMLGSMRGFAPLGEVHNTWARGARDNHFCGCGRRFSECPVWTTMMSGLASDGFSPETMQDLQGRVVRNRRVLDLLRLSRPGGGTADARRYVRGVEALLVAGASALGAGVVVDSSKRPAHGLVLRGAPGIDLTVVHLVRDSRAMAFSAMKQVAKTDSGRDGEAMRRLTSWQSARGWNRANLMAGAFERVTDRYVLVRYEDLVSDPRTELERICRVVQAPADFSWLDGERAALAPAHTVSGNPLRMIREPVTLRLDDAWREQMTATDRRVVTGVTLPLLLKYGYSPRARRRGR